MPATRSPIALLALGMALVLLDATAHAQGSGPEPSLKITPADAAPEPAPSTPAGDAAAEAARTHFKLGVELYRERNYRAALIEFQRAYDASPHYKLLYNLGQASIELQEYVRAIDYLTDYLALGGSELSDSRRSEVQATISTLEARISHVAISSDRVGAEILVDDVSVGRVPLTAPVRVAAGRHEITAVVSDAPPMERVIDIGAQEHLSVYLDFPDKPVQLPPLVTQDTAPSEDSSSDVIVPIAVVTTSVLAATAITMTIVAGLAQRRYDQEIDSVSTKSRLDELSDDAETKALLTDVAWGATLVSGAVTAVLILTDDDYREPTAGSTVRVGVGTDRISIGGRF